MKKSFGGREILAAIQSAIYVVTGVWPLVHMPSFLSVTGEKTDLWLVQVVGLLITATGLVLALAAYKREVTNSIVTLAVLNAAFLAGADIYFATSDTISNVYLLDAVLELGLVAAWIVVSRRA